MAYEMTTLSGGGGVDDHEYEVIGRGRSNTHAVTQGDVLEGMYVIPANVTQYPPPPPPLPEATPTGENVGVANEVKNTAGDTYYNITVIPANYIALSTYQ